MFDLLRPDRTHREPNHRERTQPGDRIPGPSPRTQLILIGTLLAIGTLIALAPTTAAAPDTCDIEEGDRFACTVRDGTNWLDTSEGVTLNLDTDEVSQPIDLGFEFPWYDTTQTQTNVSTKGLVCFTDQDCADYTAQPIPDPEAPNDLAACFWEDLVPTGSITYNRTTTDQGTNAFVVEYRNVKHYGTHNENTFQLQLLETGTVRCQLQDVTHDDEYDDFATAIGLENATGETGIRYTFSSFSAQDIEVAFVIPPEAPNDVVAREAYTDAPLDVEINWTHPQGDTPTYNVSYRETNNDPWTTIQTVDDATNTTHDLRGHGLDCNDTVHYAVSTEQMTFESNKTTTTYTVTCPDPPQDITATQAGPDDPLNVTTTWTHTLEDTTYPDGVTYDITYNVSFHNTTWTKIRSNLETTQTTHDLHATSTTCGDTVTYNATVLQETLQSNPSANATYTIPCPNTPTNVNPTEANTDLTVNLSWSHDPITPDPRYNASLAIDGTPVGQVLDNLDTTQTAHDLTNHADALSCDTDLDYTVLAREAKILESDPSTPGTLHLDCPSAPTGLTLSVSETTIDLDWTVPDTTGTWGVEDYDLYRCDTFGDTCSPSSEAAGIDGIAYEDSDLNNGKRYCYQVSGTTPFDGEGDLSTEECAVTVPGKPSEPRLDALENESVEIRWAAPSPDQIISGYNVYQDGAKTFHGVDSPVYHDPDVDGGQEACYTVTASNDAGEGAPSSADCIGTPGPVDELAAVGGASVNVTWGPPRNQNASQDEITSDPGSFLLPPVQDGGPEITAYHVYRCRLGNAENPAPTNLLGHSNPRQCEEGSTLERVETVGADEAQGTAAPPYERYILDDEPDESGWYSYRVHAVNDLGEGAINATEALFVASPVTNPKVDSSLPSTSGDPFDAERNLSITVYDDENDNDERDAGEQIARLQLQDNANGTCTLTADTTEGGATEHPECARPRADPRPAPGMPGPASQTVLVYDDKNDNGQPDEGDEVLLYPRVADGSDGQCVLYNDENRNGEPDGEIHNDGEGISFACPNPGADASHPDPESASPSEPLNATVVLYDDENDNGERDDGEDLARANASDRTNGTCHFSVWALGFGAEQPVDPCPRAAVDANPEDREVAVYDDKDNDGEVDEGETIAEAYANVTQNGPNCSGLDTVYIDKVGGNVTFQGETHSAVVEDLCVDSMQLPLTVTHPSGIEFGPDKDGDQVPSYVNITAADTTVEEDGSVTGPTDNGTFEQVESVDPDDNDDPRSPNAPEDLTATGQTEAIALTWTPPTRMDAPDPATAYNVYRDGTQEPIATVDASENTSQGEQTGELVVSFTDATADAGTEYCYNVTAIRAQAAGGQTESAPSKEACTTAKARTTPELELVETGSADGEVPGGWVKLHWILSSDASEFELQRKREEAFSWPDDNITQASPGEPWAIDAPDAGTWCYRVKARVDGNWTDWSTVDDGDCATVAEEAYPQPAKNPGISIEISEGQPTLTLNWTRPDHVTTGDPDDSVLGYHVYRYNHSAPAGEFPFECIASTLQTKTNYTDDSVEIGLEYSYFVTATRQPVSAAADEPGAVGPCTGTDAAGEGGSPTHVLGQVVLEAPPIPTLETVEPGVNRTEIDVAWSNNSAGKHQAAASEVVVERKNLSKDDPEWKDVATVGNDTAPHTDAGLTESTVYEYRVKGHNLEHGLTSDPSGVQASVPNGTPTEPRDFQNATPVEDFWDERKVVNVSLSWKGPAYDGGSDVDAYRVSWTDSTSGSKTVSPSSSGRNSTSVSLDCASDADRSWDFEVAASNTAHDAFGPANDSVEGIPCDAPEDPEDPENLAAEPHTTNETIRLSWDQPQGDPGAEDEDHLPPTQFNITRTNDSASRTFHVSADVNETGASSYTFWDETDDLAENESYIYEVKAENTNHTKESSSVETTVNLGQLPPEAPGLTVTETGDATGAGAWLKLDWTSGADDPSIPEPTEYWLQIQQADESWTTVSQVESSEPWAIRAPATGGEHCYRVMANNSVGTGESSSDCGNTTAGALSSPAIDVERSGDDQALEITWDAVSGANGYRVYQYNHSSPADGFPFECVAFTDQTSYTASVDKGTVHAYFVTATQAQATSQGLVSCEDGASAGEGGPPSNVVNYTIIDLAAEPGPDRATVDLSWHTSTNGFEEVRIYRDNTTNSSQGPQQIAIVPASQTAYTDRNATLQESTVYAYNLTADGNHTNASLQMATAPLGEPTKPRDFQKDSAFEDFWDKRKVINVSLSWKEPESNGGSAIANYSVSWDGATSGSKNVLHSSSEDRISTSVSLNCASDTSRSWDFEVAASNDSSSDFGPANATVTGIECDAPNDPKDPTSVEAASGPDPLEIEVTWTQPDAGDPTADGGDELPPTEFHIDRENLSDNSVVTFKVGADRVDGSSTNYRFVDDGGDLEEGTDYEYQIRAHNHNHSKTSTGTKTGTVTPLPSKPDAPDSLAASAGVRAVNLTWSGVSSSVDVDVVRSTSKNLSETPCDDGSDTVCWTVEDPGGSTTDHGDEHGGGLENGKSYHYWVRANDGGSTSSFTGPATVDSYGPPENVSTAFSRLKAATYAIDSEETDPPQVEVHWDPPAEANTGLGVDHYLVNRCFSPTGEVRAAAGTASACAVADENVSGDQTLFRDHPPENGYYCYEIVPKNRFGEAGAPSVSVDDRAVDDPAGTVGSQEEAREYCTEFVQHDRTQAGDTGDAGDGYALLIEPRTTISQDELDATNDTLVTPNQDDELVFTVHADHYTQTDDPPGQADRVSIDAAETTLAFALVNHTFLPPDGPFDPTQSITADCHNDPDQDDAFAFCAVGTASKVGAFTLGADNDEVNVTIPTDGIGDGAYAAWAFIQAEDGRTWLETPTSNPDEQVRVQPVSGFHSAVKNTLHTEDPANPTLDLLDHHATPLLYIDPPTPTAGADCSPSEPQPGDATTCHAYADAEGDGNNEADENATVPGSGDAGDGYALFIEPHTNLLSETPPVWVPPTNQGEYKFRVYADAYGEDGTASSVDIDSGTPVAFALVDQTLLASGSFDPTASITQNCTDDADDPTAYCANGTPGQHDDLELNGNVVTVTIDAGDIDPGSYGAWAFVRAEEPRTWIDGRPTGESVSVQPVSGFHSGLKNTVREVDRGSPVLDPLDYHFTPLRLSDPPVDSFTSDLGWAPTTPTGQGRTYNLSQLYDDGPLSLDTDLVETNSGTDIEFEVNLPFPAKSGNGDAPTNDNFALLFDENDDGRADFQVVYAAGGNQWHYEEPKEEDTSEWTPDPWNGEALDFPTDIDVQREQGSQTFTVQFPVDRLGGKGSDYRFMLHAVDNVDAPACDGNLLYATLPPTTDPYARTTNPDSWTSSDNYQRATVGGSADPLQPAPVTPTGGPAACPLEQPDPGGTPSSP